MGEEILKVLYIDCSMGAAGDMLTSALLELLPDPDSFVERLNALHLPGVTYEAAKTQKCGITGTHMTVRVDGVEEGSQDYHGHDHDHDHDHLHHDHHDHEHGHSHAHHTMKDIELIVKNLQIPDKTKEDVMAVYRLIAEAESHVHGQPVEQIHFHEVGTMDAVADVTAVCLLLYELAPDSIQASPIHVGSGHVHCAHGILPVPAPATACILKGIPAYGGSVQGELCTPTGAALLKHFVDIYGNQPLMSVRKIGYGMGKKNFAQANCVRAMLGESTDDRTTSGQEEDGFDTILELVCNLDDMTPEEIGFATDRLLAAGALDVFTLSAGMKKNRPGIVLTVLCRTPDEEKMARLLFACTTTLGIRTRKCRRYILKREMQHKETSLGQVRVKRSYGWGADRRKAEYDDLSAIALREDLSLREVKERIRGEGKAAADS